MACSYSVVIPLILIHQAIDTFVDLQQSADQVKTAGGSNIVSATHESQNWAIWAIPEYPAADTPFVMIQERGLWDNI